MTHPDGGFYSAEDADSEGHEGKFYCWTKDELSQLLTVEEFNVAAKYFGITAEGNFVDHSHPKPLAGQNVLSIVNPIGRDGVSPSQTSSRKIGDAGTASLPNDLELFASAKRKMLDARAKRIRPHLDDKILTSWNGLMLGAFARAGATLGDEKYRAAAEKNLQFIRGKLWEPPQGRAGSPLPADGAHGVTRPTGTLFHRWRDGERDNVQLLASYAFLLSGVIELYEATLEPSHLDFAVELAEAMIAKFYDAENGGFWQSAGGAADLIMRVKDDYDGAEPSGNSVATLALLKLGAVTGRRDFTVAAEKTLHCSPAVCKTFPQAMPFMLHALDFWLQEPRRVVVAGDPPSLRFGAASQDAADYRELLRAAHSVYQPNKIVLGNSGAVEAFARGLPSKNEAVVYVCAGTSCQLPTGDAARVRALLQ